MLDNKDGREPLLLRDLQLPAEVTVQLIRNLKFETVTPARIRYNPP